MALQISLNNSAWFRDQVIACVGRVVTVNPRQFQVIRKSVKKTDRNDARALAFFLSKDMLPETRVKTRAESELARIDQFVAEAASTLESPALEDSRRPAA